MELRQLRYFAAIAEEQGFHKAARRLHVAQPALTACVKQLEAELGHRLLDRTRHHVALTVAGRELLHEARRLLDGERTAREAVRAAAAGRGGTLRLGIIATAMVQPVALLLRTFHRTHPGVALQLCQEDLSRLVDSMDKGDLHAVIGRPEAANRHHRKIPLCAEEQGLAVPESHPLAAMSRIPLQRLHGERLMLLRDNPHFGRLLRDACASRGIQPELHHAADNLSELLWLVSAGLGCCPCSLLLGHQLPPGAVLCPLAGGAPKLQISLLVPDPAGHPAAAALAGMAMELARGVGKPGRAPPGSIR